RGEDPEAAAADRALRPRGRAPRRRGIPLQVGAAVARAAAPPGVELALDRRPRRARLARRPPARPPPAAPGPPGPRAARCAPARDRRRDRDVRVPPRRPGRLGRLLVPAAA